MEEQISTPKPDDLLDQDEGTRHAGVRKRHLPRRNAVQTLGG